VLAQRQLLERLFEHDIGLPEERLRRCNRMRLPTQLLRNGHHYILGRLIAPSRHQSTGVVDECSIHASRSVSYAGDPERLHRVLHKLIRGDAITVSTVGGSVTGGS
jgi:hypothetical protein